MANHLASETSPYLLQHAHNPVNWFPWGEEALTLARAQNKPILVSIGYSACHWCHVMERESFEVQQTADLMNAHFINIKVDREERPDLDHVYMDAVQAMTGQGGWPLNVFLTPDTRPFFGGTYFPPQRYGQRPSWTEVLKSVSTAFQQQGTDIEAQADNMLKHLQNANQAMTGEEGNIFSTPPQEMAATIRTALLQQADTVWGGFGRAPKFPQTFSIGYLLRDYYFTGEQSSIKQALLSLDKMIQGGIYDQIGGGFARYSTDDKWLAPHFEKMLYDNALLLGVLAEAYQLTQNQVYQQTIRQTVQFLEREMLHAEGGFYAALDADSEGEEGKYYTWQKEEIEAVLGAEAELFCLVYDVENQGNWEQTNILWLPQQIKEIATPLKIDPDQLSAVIKGCQQKLLEARDKRVHPGLDDKILLSWNAMLITALCKAYGALKEQYFLSLAIKTYAFLKQHLAGQGGQWQHTWKNGQAKINAFLDDYAQIIEAAIILHEVTADKAYLADAVVTIQYVLDNFSTDEEVFFYYTEKKQAIIIRKIELYDNATPSGNAVMADNLLQLSVLLDKPKWRERAYAMVQAIGNTMSRYPSSFGRWSSVWQKMGYGIQEIAVIGEHAPALSKTILENFLPNHILQFATLPLEEFPLLADKLVPDGKTFIYLCQDYSCRQPVETVQALLDQLRVIGTTSN